MRAPRHDPAQHKRACLDRIRCAPLDADCIGFLDACVEAFLPSTERCGLSPRV